MSNQATFKLKLNHSFTLKVTNISSTYIVGEVYSSLQSETINLTHQELTDFWELI